MKRKFKDLKIGDIIYLFTKEDVRKIRIISIQKTTYNYEGFDPDYYIESVDIENDKVYRVLADANYSTYNDELNEIIYVINPYLTFMSDDIYIR